MRTVVLPLYAGDVTDGTAEMRSAFPLNLIPVPRGTGVSDTHFRPADGTEVIGQGFGRARGAITWNDKIYMVSGDRLIRVSEDGSVEPLGGVPDDGQPAALAYSNDRLAITSAGRLYYWQPERGIQEVTDRDRGTAYGVIWIDGYFMFTDGEYAIVTDLSDPFQVDPLKYGSAERDPDGIQALLPDNAAGIVYVFGRYTAEIFANVGTSAAGNEAGDVFPFERSQGTSVEKGAVGRKACVRHGGGVAFIGGGKSERPGVYYMEQAQALKISTPDIDDFLTALTAEQLKALEMESRFDSSHEFLTVHLPDKTIVWDGAATRAAETNIWFILSDSATSQNQRYGARHLRLLGNSWIGGDAQTADIVRLTKGDGSRKGKQVRWELSTAALAAQGAPMTFLSAELQCLQGAGQSFTEHYIHLEYTEDGRRWSAPMLCTVGGMGTSSRRVQWRNCGFMRHGWRAFRVHGLSEARITPQKLTFEVVP